MSSRERGKRGEREARDAWNQHIGAGAIRSAQSHGKEAADLLGTGAVHVEVKKRRKIAVQSFMDQAVGDCGERIPVVMMRQDRGGWLVMLRVEDARAFAREVLGTATIPACSPRP